MTTFGENFTDSELTVLRASPCLLDMIRATFFFHSADAFLALCSLIAHGKNCASPNKKIRRAARQELFSKIAYETFPIKNHGNIKLSYFEVITGLQALSGRWSHYSYDELLSLVFVLDAKNKGSLSNEEFEAFTELVEAAIYKDPSKHVEAFTALYESLRAEVMSFARDTNIHASLRDKLTALANRARYLQQTPLTMMYSLSEEHNHHCPNNVFVELLVEMVEFVKKHHLKVEKTAVVDVYTGPVIQDTSPTSSTPSRRGSLAASSNSPGRTSNTGGEGGISRLGSSDSAFDHQSVNSYTTPVKEGSHRRASGQGTTPSKESVRRSSVKPAPISASKGRRHSTSSSGNDFSPKSHSSFIFPDTITSTDPALTSVAPATSVVSDDKKPSSPAVNKSITDVGVNVDLDEPKKAKVAEKLKEFKSKEDEINGSLSALDKQLEDSQTQLKNLQLAKQDKQTNSVPPLSTEVEATSTASPSSPSKKTKPINPFSSPVPTATSAAASLNGATPDESKAKEVTMEEPVESVTAANIDSILKTDNAAASAAALNDVSGVVDDATISVISSIAPPSVFSSGGGSAVFSRKEIQRMDKASTPAVANGHSSRNLLSNNKIYAFGSSTNSLNRVNSRRSNNDDYRDHSRYQEPPKAVNMNIFRTPLHRQRHPNRNQFDAKNTCWFPTKVSNRYNERFQYPDDLRIADKINSVFYNNINPR